MHQAVMRIAVSREGFDGEEEPYIPPLTEEEDLMVAPPDVAAQDPEVAAAVVDEQTEEEGLVNSINTLTDAGVEAEGVIAQLQEAGPEVTDTAVLVAQERLSSIFHRVGMSVRRASRESMAVAPNPPDAKEVADDNRPGPYSAAQDLIADSEKNLEFIKVAANEGLREFANRIAVNTKNLFRWSTTYAKEARAVAAAARNTKGTPTDAVYNNRLRIAYFTNAQQEPLTDGKAVADALGNMSRNIRAINGVSEQLGSVFKFFNKGTGRLDLPTMFGQLEKTTDAHDGEALSITGTAALFGEELVLTGADVSQAVNNQEEMMQALGHAKVQLVERWKVSDLPSEINLPVMSAQDVASSASQLEGIAQQLVADYRIVAAMINRVQQQPTTIRGAIVDIALDAASNSNMVKFRGRINRLISSIAFGCDQTVNHKAKTLNCLMDYYKWSLKNHKAVGNEGLAPATEGIVGIVGGFIVGSFSLGIGNAVMNAQAERLRQQIKLAAKDIHRLRIQGSKAALAEGSIDRAVYEAQVGVPIGAIISGAIFGTMFGGFYGAVVGHELEENEKKLQAKVAELKELVMRARREENEKEREIEAALLKQRNEELQKQAAAGKSE